MKRMGVRELRDQLGRRVDEAHYRGEHTIVEKNGEPRAVLVPYGWWQQRQGQQAQSAPDSTETGGATRLHTTGTFRRRPEGRSATREHR